jgi:hypothetical protein
MSVTSPYLFKTPRSSGLNTKALKAAALHFASKLVEGDEVPVGTYDLSGVRLVIDLGEGAVVVRGPGDNGDGFDKAGAKKVVVSHEALIMLLDQAGLLKSLTAEEWNAFAANAVKTIGKGRISNNGAAAIIAVELLSKTLTEGAPSTKRKTPANRLGTEHASVRVSLASDLE